MAKAKTKKAPSKAKKADKEAAGKKTKALKLSKTLRNFAPVKDLMKSDLGREILADALIAAAAAAAAALTHSRRGKAASKAVAQAGAHAVQTASGTVAGVVADTARHLLPAFMGEHEEGTEAPRGRAAAHKASGAEGGAKRPQYAHLTSDHSKRKTSKKTSPGGN